VETLSATIVLSIDYGVNTLNGPVRSDTLRHCLSTEHGEPRALEE
jgi:hypothetical protein